MKFQKGCVQRVITGWRQNTTDQIARRYNGGGDPRCAKKLDYARPDTQMREMRMQISSFIIVVGALSLQGYSGVVWATEIQSERWSRERCGAHSDGLRSWPRAAKACRPGSYRRTSPAAKTAHGARSCQR